MRTPSIYRLLSLLIALFPLIASAEAIQLGASYGEVIQALGEPDGELSAGSKQILTYGTAQVILRDKKVTAISPDLERLLAERTDKRDAVKAEREANLVNFRGLWVTPQKKKKLLRAESSKRHLNGKNQSDSGVWLTNFNQASTLAKSQNKQLLLNFTGSDWCSWCIKLDREVFSQPEFMNYARAHYVLVKLDFPKRKRLSASLQQQNHALAKKYRVQGTPPSSS